MALTSLSMVKQVLGIGQSDVSRDPQLSAMREMAEISVKNYCGQNFEPTTYTCFLDGNDRREMILPQRPVTSITSVAWDAGGNFGDNPGGSFSSLTNLIFGQDFDISWDGVYPPGSSTRVSHSGCLLRLNSVWARRSRTWFPATIGPESAPCYGSFKVVYTAGFSPIPLDLQYATCYICSYMRRTIPVGGELGSERIDLYSYDIHYPRYGLIPAEIGAARQILSRYREVSF